MKADFFDDDLAAPSTLVSTRLTVDRAYYTSCRQGFDNLRANQNPSNFCRRNLVQPRPKRRNLVPRVISVGTGKSCPNLFVHWFTHSTSQGLLQ